jgi:hypothetical protein
MITIFCVFDNFSFVLSQKRRFFRKFFRRKYLKIITLVPDWTIFCLLGSYLLRAVFRKLWKYCIHIYGLFIPRYKQIMFVLTNWVGVHFGRFFTTTSGHLGCHPLIFLGSAPVRKNAKCHDVLKTNQNLKRNKP